MEVVEVKSAVITSVVSPGAVDIGSIRSNAPTIIAPRKLSGISFADPILNLLSPLSFITYCPIYRFVG